jgi:hypothetical protein
VLDRQRGEIVFLQQLDRPLSASARGGDEQHGLVLITRAAQLADPVRNAPMELTHRLTGDVHRAGSLHARSGTFAACGGGAGFFQFAAQHDRVGLERRRVHINSLAPLAGRGLPPQRANSARRGPRRG